MSSTSIDRCVVVMLSLITVPTVAAEHTTDSLAVVLKNVADHKAVLVDVCETVEWKAGHIAGAISMPIN